MKDEEIMEGKLLIRKKNTHYNNSETSIPPEETKRIAYEEGDFEGSTNEIKVIATVVLLILGAFLILTSFSKEYIYDEETESYVNEHVIPIQNEYYVYYDVLERLKGDEIEIEYEVASGERVKVMIFDDKNKLNEWASGGSLDAIYQTTKNGDNLDYVMISDGDIYIAFYNTNAETIELTLSIEDKTDNINYKSIILGGIFCIVGFWILIRQDKLK